MRGTTPKLERFWMEITLKTIRRN